MGLFDLFQKKEKTCICARCRKVVKESETSWVGNHRFCSQCWSTSPKPASQWGGTVMPAKKRAYASDLSTGNQAYAMVQTIHNMYASGNDMAYLALLNGVGANRLEVRPGAGHNYPLVIDAIHLYQKDHPQASVKAGYYEGLLTNARLIKNETGLQNVFNFLNYQRKKEKDNTAHFTIDIDPVMEALEPHIRRIREEMEEPRQAEFDRWINVQKRDLIGEPKAESTYTCFRCGVKVPDSRRQYAYGRGCCQACGEKYQRIAQALQENRDPYAFLGDSGREKKAPLIRGIPVDDVTYVKSSIQKEKLEKQYYQGKTANDRYLFHFDDRGEEFRVLLNMDLGIPLVQFLLHSPMDLRPGSVCEDIKNVISFYELELLAERSSKEVYASFRGMTPENWREYKLFTCQKCGKTLAERFLREDGCCVSCLPQEILCGWEKLRIVSGKLVCKNKEITPAQARRMETDQRGSLAYTDYAKGHGSLEEACARHGFVRDSRNQWVLKSYVIDQYLHFLSDPGDVQSVPLEKMNLGIVHTGDAVENRTVYLRFYPDGRITVVRQDWWGAGQGFCNGGESEQDLPADYFRTHTLQTFISYLEERFSMDCSCLKTLQPIIDLFQPKTRPSGPIEVTRTILREVKPGPGAAFAFEKDALVIEVLRAEGTEFVRITRYTCFAGGNGRPLYNMYEDYYRLGDVELDAITGENYKERIPAKPVYCHGEGGQGVLF